MLAAISCRASEPPPERSGSSPTPPENTSGRILTPLPRIVALGDSLTAGAGIPSEHAYPALLQQTLKDAGYTLEVVNAGVSGDTSADGLRRAGWALEGDVRLLILALGANDGLRGLPAAQMKRNLHGIIHRARQRGIPVLLVGMEAPPNYGEQYASQFRRVFQDLARENKIPLVPFLLEGVAGVVELNQADGIHPTRAGAARIADHLWPAVEKMIETAKMIELRGVSKTVKSGDHQLTILHSLDLRVPTGQRLAIVGPSGSGKSTLLGLIAGLDAPTSGSIWIDGTDVTLLGEDQLARLRGEKIGFVFQSFHLIPSLTAVENILVPMEIAGRRDAMARARELLVEVGLEDRGHHYPSQLSGGEQQRIAIARALSNEPVIVLADEPTGNLDTKTGHQVIELLRTINEQRGATLVVVTHDQEIAAMADARVYLRDGQVAERVSI